MTLTLPIFTLIRWTPSMSQQVVQRHPDLQVTHNSMLPILLSLVRHCDRYSLGENSLLSAAQLFCLCFRCCYVWNRCCCSSTDTGNASSGAGDWSAGRQRCVCACRVAGVGRRSAADFIAFVRRTPTACKQHISFVSHAHASEPGRKAAASGATARWRTAAGSHSAPASETQGPTTADAGSKGCCKRSESGSESRRESCESRRQGREPGDGGQDFFVRHSQHHISTK